MVKCLAQGHKCHGWDSNPHSAATELESGKLDRSATTPLELFDSRGPRGHARNPSVLGGLSVFISTKRTDVTAR